MKKTTLIALLVSAALVSVGSAQAAHAAKPKPEAMLVAILKYYSFGQYGRAYDLLVPGQQKVIKRDKFIECWQETLPTFDFVSFKKLDSYADPIHVTGVPQRTSTAVTIRWTASIDGKKETQNDTWHAVWIGTRWAWVLTSTNVAELKRGVCPS